MDQDGEQSRKKTAEYRISEYNRIKEYGLKHGVELLSSEYVGRHEKLKWKRLCDGVIFEKTFSGVLNNSFPDPNNKKSNSKILKPEDHMNTLQKIAEQRGGKLLSTVWTNNSDKYDFLDVSGNKISIVANLVKQGLWSVHETCKGGAKITKKDDEVTIVTKSGNIIVYDIVDGMKVLKSFIPAK